MNLDFFILKYNRGQGKEFNIELKYSTPSQFFEEQMKSDIEWPTFYDDMFPYQDFDHEPNHMIELSENAIWTGFFSSKPRLKSYIRYASQQYHSSSQIFAEMVIDQRYEGYT